MKLLDRFKHSLARTRAAIVSQFVSPGWNAEEMERALIAADFGPRLAAGITAGVQKRLQLNPRATKKEAISAAKAEIVELLQASSHKLQAISVEHLSAIAASYAEVATKAESAKADRASSPELLILDSHSVLSPQSSVLPQVILLVGVNGTGKTTTIAKLARRYQAEGGKVILAAADTFRAAAIDQLKLWGKRLSVEVAAGNYGADPGSVAHDAVRRAQVGSFTHLLVDTAGRQHTKSNLMQELQKVKRVLSKVLPGAPHETWLVVDAPTGGNAVAQAREFHAAMDLTGVIITKLDGTSKGGVVVAICKETGLPIRFIGLGEGPDDLEPFDPKAFAEALLG